jgi:hypothetical protein
VLVGASKARFQTAYGLVNARFLLWT